jgi:RNA polymerase sigma-70 factor, ECF subfamily
MCAWLFAILRNLFRSEYRKRRREVQDTDGSYLDSLKSPPEQHSRVESRLYKIAHWAPASRRQISGTRVPESLSSQRQHRARTRLSELLAIDNADRFGPDHTTRAILTTR